MSDLSWLNPTPHAIAVYASRPLSPVAAQHSLPSGRYSLLGPDFHRLDRTSLRLAHSIDQPRPSSVRARPAAVHPAAAIIRAPAHADARQRAAQSDLATGPAEPSPACPARAAASVARSTRRAHASGSR